MLPTHVQTPWNTDHVHDMNSEVISQHLGASGHIQALVQGLWSSKSRGCGPVARSKGCGPTNVVGQEVGLMVRGRKGA